MGVNKMRPHIVVIPEDEANIQLVNGFLQHYAVNSGQLGVESPAGGWQPALALFESEYVRYLKKYPSGYVILLIDFDGKVADRRKVCDETIPNDLKDRVFVLGTLDEPEALRREIKLSFENIGENVARDCERNQTQFWSHEHLSLNLSELVRLLPIAHAILFPKA